MARKAPSPSLNSKLRPTSVSALPSAKRPMITMIARPVTSISVSTMRMCDANCQPTIRRENASMTNEKNTTPSQQRR